MEDNKYGFGRTLPGVQLEDAVGRVISALNMVGFVILSRININETLQRKLGRAFRLYTILGACNPKLALRALNAEPLVGLLMPCNVLVQQVDDGVHVSMMDSDAVAPLVEAEDAVEVMSEARQLLKRALNDIIA